jgi:precorrin-6A/cobalt-precorrin-6A reductase
MSRILILGGTAEARRLADCLGDHAVITSLAGRTRNPAQTAGEVRVGGFGGTDALAAYLREVGIEAVVDATHPFAIQISANAVAACMQEHVPRLALVRPPWHAELGDRWTEVADAEAAAQALDGYAKAFLAVGRQGLAPFAHCRDIVFVVRVVELPETVPLAHATVVVGRGPFALAAERTLLAEHHIDVVVAKNAGGDRAKLDAAREANIPVILIARPPPPPGPAVRTVAEAVDWVRVL